MKVIVIHRTTYDIIEITSVTQILLVGTGDTHVVVTGKLTGAETATQNQYARADYIVRIMES